MDSNPDPMVMDTTADSFKPFTVAERIQQLGEIDKNISKLMAHTASALSALTPSSTVPLSTQKQTFQDSMDAFMTTLHTVDVHMKRQILGLEEAGIIDLANDRANAAALAADDEAGPASSLNPTAAGTIGNLDVGWLNSRKNRVEREMEAELWAKGRAFLETSGKDAAHVKGEPMEE